MTRAFVGVGSNIHPAINIEKALRLLARDTQLIAVSTVYQTKAEGRPDGPSYYNCVVEIETNAPPAALKSGVLRTIEQALCRQRGQDKFADRTIDLDLVLYDGLVMSTEDLTLPDPDVTRRPFLAIPLFELAPDLVLPGSSESIRQIAEAMPWHDMKPLEAYTEHLRKELLHERKP